MKINLLSESVWNVPDLVTFSYTAMFKPWCNLVALSLQSGLEYVCQLLVHLRKRCEDRFGFVEDKYVWWRMTICPKVKQWINLTIRWASLISLLFQSSDKMLAWFDKPDKYLHPYQQELRNLTSMPHLKYLCLKTQFYIVTKTGLQLWSFSCEKIK